jgi:hypothetical protein
MKRTLLAAALALSLVSRAALAQDDDYPPPPPPPDDAEAATAPPADAAPPAQAPTQEAFEQRLSPYGRWVDTPEYGRVWMPAGVGPDWQPYADGRWVDTAYGWTFVATVPWGPWVFHYGRWGWRGGFGWYWVPGFVWGPAWVHWRWVNGWACWTPRAPRGFVFGRTWPGWVVVPHAHFTAPIHRWAVPLASRSEIVRSARPLGAFPSAHGRAYGGWRGGGGWHGGGGRGGGGRGGGGHGGRR